MTVGAVAALAGVSEPTVYLRYPTKRHLALAAVTHIPLLVDPPDTGDALDDLTALLTRLVAATESASGMALTGAALAEEQEHPEFLERWRSGVGTALRSVVGHIVERGQARGQLRAGLSGDIVADLLLGAHLGRYTYRGRPGRGWARQVVNAVRPALEA